MTEPASFLAVVDVGHGNSTVLSSNNQTAVIDAGRGAALMSFLLDRKIHEIDLVLISHADQDHIGGLMSLLTEGFKIKQIMLNTDSLKNSAIWFALTDELQKYHLANKMHFSVGLTRSNQPISIGNATISIVAPSPLFAVRGPGSNVNGKRLTSNSVSAAMRITYGSMPVALLAGDIDEVSLSEIESSSVDVSARMLVFPHHGGLPGSKGSDRFCVALMNLVKPSEVIFSIGREKYNTPRREVVAALKRASGTARILCTQLSLHCAKALPSVAPDHLSDFFALGREKKHCCAGTVVVHLPSACLLPSTLSHDDFIRSNAPTALCRLPVLTPT